LGAGQAPPLIEQAAASTPSSTAGPAEARAGSPAAGLDEIAHNYGPRRHLPPDFPDFKPIALAISKLKTWLRTAQARTRDLLEDAMRAAAEWLTEADAKNWFAHCGSHVHQLGNRAKCFLRQF